MVSTIKWTQKNGEMCYAIQWYCASLTRPFLCGSRRRQLWPWGETGCSCRGWRPGGKAEGMKMCIAVEQHGSWVHSKSTQTHSHTHKGTWVYVYKYAHKYMYAYIPTNTAVLRRTLNDTHGHGWFTLGLGYDLFTVNIPVLTASPEETVWWPDL